MDFTSYNVRLSGKPPLTGREMVAALPEIDAIAEIVFDEFLEFAATFADQTDDNRIGLGITRKHRHQRRFADAGAGENAHALALAAGHKGIQRPHPKVQLTADPVA